MSEQGGYVHPEVLCELPEGIEIKPNAYGHGVFASKAFAGSETMYEGHCAMIEDRPGKVPVRTNHGQTYILDVLTHSVKQWGNNMRQLYTFDAFMNHSCAPNSESRLLSKTAETQQYDMVAVRDVIAGEEITCDYTLFEYDCTDKAIFECACGAGAQCLRDVRGFKFLTRAQQLQRFHRADREVIDAFLVDNPTCCYWDFTSCLPHGVALVLRSTDSTLYMIATRRFEAGEVLFTNATEPIDTPCEDLIVSITDIQTENGRMTVELPGSRCTLGSAAGPWLYLGFDTFRVLDGQGEHNTVEVTLNTTRTHYEVVASTDIAVRETIYGVVTTMFEST